MPLTSLAFAVAEPLLHHAAQRGVEVAVVQEIVGHLLQERVGVEVEADLRAVPTRVLEARPGHGRRLPAQRSPWSGHPAERRKGCSEACH